MIVGVWERDKKWNWLFLLFFSLFLLTSSSKSLTLVKIWEWLVVTDCNCNISSAFFLAYLTHITEADAFHLHNKCKTMCRNMTICNIVKLNICHTKWQAHLPRGELCGVLRANHPISSFFVGCNIVCLPKVTLQSSQSSSLPSREWEHRMVCRRRFWRHGKKTISFKVKL